MNKISGEEARAMLSAAVEIFNEKSNEEIQELRWTEKLKWDIINGLDAADKAIQFRQARESKWKRVTKRLFKILEAVVLIGGYFAAKKLPLSNLLNKIG